MAAAILVRPALGQTDSQSPSSGEPLTKAVSVTIGDNISHDSNLFKVPASSNPQSETINTAYARLQIDKPYSLQRFQLDVTDTMRRYDSSTYLNFKALDYRAAWLWQLTSRLTGSLNANRTENLVPFQDILGTGTTQRNVRISEIRAFSLDGWIFGSWHLILGGSQSTQSSEQATVLQPDFRSVSRNVGVRYTPASGNSITVTRRTTDGDYLNQAVSSGAYRQDDSEISVTWSPSGKSSLTGLLTRQTRTQNQSSVSGLNGNVGYSWRPTGKLSVNFTAARTNTPNLDPSAGDRVTDTLSIASSWQTSAKTSVRMNLARTTGSFAGSATSPSSTDTMNTGGLGVNWSPLQRLSVGASVQRQLRSGRSASASTTVTSFNDTTATLTASLRF